MANKKILILGARGNLGGQLAKVLSDGNSIIPWDREEIDITDKDLIARKISELKPDIIINAAAYNAVDKCEADEAELAVANKINVEAVANIAKSALEIGALFIHFSTDYVFGGHAHHHSKTVSEIKAQGGYLETDEPRPVNKYGQTKFGGEQEMIKLSGKGLKWYLIRTSKLFGPKGESELAKPSFFDVMLRLSKDGSYAKATGGEGKLLEVVDDEMSCFTYTPDLARAVKKLIEANVGYGIYHIYNTGACTWYKAAKKLFKITLTNIKVLPVPSDKFPRPAKRPKYSVLKNTKLEPLRDYGEALREYLKDELKIV